MNIVAFIEKDKSLNVTNIYTYNLIKIRLISINP